jgi:Na+/melibiose symporter-like transporter
MLKKDFAEKLRACRDYTRRITRTFLTFFLIIFVLPMPFTRYLNQLPKTKGYLFAVLWVVVMSSFWICWFIKILKSGKKFGLCCLECGHDLYRSSESEIEDVLADGKCTNCDNQLFEDA